MRKELNYMYQLILKEVVRWDKELMFWLYMCMVGVPDHSITLFKTSAFIHHPPNNYNHNHTQLTSQSHQITMSNVTAASRNALECIECDITFLTIGAIKHHRRTTHFSRQAMSGDQADVIRDVDTGHFHCPEEGCSYTNKDGRVLKAHFEKKHTAFYQSNSTAPQVNATVTATATATQPGPEATATTATTGDDADMQDTTQANATATQPGSEAPPTGNDSTNQPGTEASTTGTAGPTEETVSNILST